MSGLFGSDDGRRRVRQVFSFLRAFAEGRAPTVRTLDDVAQKLRLRELPDHPAIQLGVVSLRGREPYPEHHEPRAEPLLRVRRPELVKAPPPPEILTGWALHGWEKPDGRVAVWEVRRRRGPGGELEPEKFAADPARQRALTEWSRAWKQWAAAERPAHQAMRVFELLYALHSDIERQGERIELVLGDGRLLWRTPEGAIDHPVLLQRVDLVFDPDVPEFRLVDSDRLPELCGPLLVSGGTLPGEKLNELQQELEAGGYHPLAREETSAFLRRLVSLLGPSGVLTEEDPKELRSPDGPVIARDAWLLVRDRAAGFSAAFDRVLEDLEHRRDVPVALSRIVGIEPERPARGDRRAITVAGEAVDILLSKPANAEQIEIVRTLERHEAVLVQGPPGTGKSHTIANLVGHLVAQGKRVLVTSYTTKALRVVRDLMVEELRPLSVALLDNDVEGRTQMEQAVRGIIQRLSTSTEEKMQAEVAALASDRDKLIVAVERLDFDLRSVRENEYVPIKLAGEEVAPGEAARFVGENSHRLDLIPGPIPPATPLPLTEAELRELYESNDAVSPDEEDELSQKLPGESSVPTPDQFEADVASVHATKRADSERFWSRAPEAGDTTALQAAARSAEDLTRDIAALASWQRKLVAAGHTGGAEQELWRQLAQQVKRAASRWREAHPLLLEHAPTIDPALPKKEVREALAEIHAHVGEGGKVSGLGMLFRGKWKSVLEGCRTNGAPPTEPAHFAALHGLAEIEHSRAELSQRWARHAEGAGLPAFSLLPDPPEPTLSEYAEQFERLLGLWAERWRPLQAELEALALSWSNLRAAEIAKAAPSVPFESDVLIAGTPLRATIDKRLDAAGRLNALKRFKALADELDRYQARVCKALHTAVADLEIAVYRREYGRLQEGWRQLATLKRRRALLQRLAAGAPGWAAAIEARRGAHGAPFPPRDLDAAWRWRQLEQELSRRANLDEGALATALESHLQQLRRATVDLVDRKAWLEQLRGTGLEARQALVGWADTQRLIAKGTGKRTPELQMKARELLSRAREAVPVWIMPLARVAESFDPRHARFDVVVIDEASQCDLTGLLAVYLGDQVAIVGDHEQVSPSAVNDAVENAGALISQYLGGIPNSHLYDGQTSVYDLARQSFGGTIGLREHFRCVPDIIEFSNQLSYHLEIRPLRDPNTGRRPHLVEYHVSQALMPVRREERNEAEARAVAALVAAAMRLPEYEHSTFGAISLAGDEQATRIQQLVSALVPIDQLERRRFVAGNPAQFQGDERDIIFLSMVDAPVGAPLLLQDRITLKQRYNVAASRARDQLWLVHCLDPRRDLQPADLRRRLIEHVRQPAAVRGHGQPGARRTPSAFEQAVFQRLVQEGYRVEVQVPVGGYRIDLVVSDGKRQVAVECDGDRFQSIDRLGEEMDKQRVLERVGWRFRRVRATRFWRDPDGTMAAVFKDLHRLGVEPLRADGGKTVVMDLGENLENKIIRLAWQIMRTEDWVKEPRAGAEGLPLLEPLGGVITELMQEDATEPRFVVLEETDEQT